MDLQIQKFRVYPALNTLRTAYANICRAAANFIKNYFGCFATILNKIFIQTFKKCNTFVFLASFKKNLE